MGYPNKDALKKDHRAYKFDLGEDSVAGPRKIRMTPVSGSEDQGYPMVVMMGSDPSGDPIAFALDALGQLKIAATVTAYIDEVETKLDTLIDYLDEVETKLDALEQSNDDSLSEYKISDMDNGNATYDYFGFLRKDGYWYIMRQDKSGGDSVFRYDSGTSGYSTAWTGRAGLSYQYFNLEF